MCLSAQTFCKDPWSLMLASTSLSVDTKHRRTRPKWLPMPVSLGFLVPSLHLCSPGTAPASPGGQVSVGLCPFSSPQRALCLLCRQPGPCGFELQTVLSILHTLLNDGFAEWAWLPWCAEQEAGAQTGWMTGIPAISRMGSDPGHRGYSLGPRLDSRLSQYSGTLSMHHIHSFISTVSPTCAAPLCPQVSLVLPGQRENPLWILALPFSVFFQGRTFLKRGRKLPPPTP